VRPSPLVKLRSRKRLSVCRENLGAFQSRWSSSFSMEGFIAFIWNFVREVLNSLRGPLLSRIGREFSRHLIFLRPWPFFRRG